MGHVLDSTLMHINKGKAYESQGKAPRMRLNFQHSSLLRLLYRIQTDTRYQALPNLQSKKIQQAAFIKKTKFNSAVLNLT